MQDEPALLAEAEAASLSAARRASEAAADGSNGQAWSVLVVGPDASVGRAIAAASLGGAVSVRGIALGGGEPPVVDVEADGTATLPTGERGKLPVAAAMPHVVSAAVIEGPVIEVITPEPATPDAAASISVDVLGPYRISLDGAEVTGGLRKKARELLALLALSPEGVTLDAAVETLWPSIDVDKAQGYFRQVVANLRSTLRPAGAAEDWEPVERVVNRYRLDKRAIAVDAAAFESATRSAVTGDDAAARRAVELYRGALLDGEDFPWAEPERERLRRRVLDVLTRAAAFRRADGDLHGAADALDRAIALDPHSEPLYRDLMETQRELGSEDGLRRTYARLEAALGEIGLQPTARTTALLNADASPLA